MILGTEPSNRLDCPPVTDQMYPGEGLAVVCFPVSASPQRDEFLGEDIPLHGDKVLALDVGLEPGCTWS